MSTAHSTAVTAGIFRRLLALIYDAVLLLGIGFGYGVAVLLIRKALGADTANPPGNLLQTLILTGLWASCGLYYCWCWLRAGQTLGMKSWRLRLQAADGGQLSWKQCILRCIFAPFALMLLGIGYLWCLFDSNGDCLHDKFTHTQVVVLPKKQKI